MILCGGSGTGLWPLSRENYPKQFLQLFGKRSLLQETFLRMRKIMAGGNIFFVTNQENYFNVLNQIREIEPSFSQKQILVEPRSRNTFAAIAYAVKRLGGKLEIDPTDPIIFLPADHCIQDEKKFLEMVISSMSQVKDFIGAIGVAPTRPETSFGYIQKGKKQDSFNRVDKFIEKPDKKMIEDFVRSGEYLWNTGMYLFNIKAFIREIELHVPKMYQLIGLKFGPFIEQFDSLDPVSFDHAISERSKNLIVFEGGFGWSDVGSFDSLAEAYERDGLNGSRIVAVDSKNIFAYSDSDRLIATVGIDDCGRD